MDNIHSLSDNLGASSSFRDEMHAQPYRQKASTNHKYWRAAEYAMLQQSSINNGLRGMAPASMESPRPARGVGNRDDLLSGLAHNAHGRPQRWPLPAITKVHVAPRSYAGHLHRRPATSWNRPVTWNGSIPIRSAEYAKQWYATKRFEAKSSEAVASGHIHSTHLPRRNTLPRSVAFEQGCDPPPRPVFSELESHNPTRPVASRLKRAFEEEFTGQVLERHVTSTLEASELSKVGKVEKVPSSTKTSLLDMLCATTLELGPIQNNPTGCSCPRSNCIKLYCDCFKAGRRCTGACSCVSCKNTLAETRPDGERILAIKNTLARNPRAFTGGKKEAVPRNPGVSVCNCVKSKCLKLYCDCFHSGKFCNAACDCNSCFNTIEESGISGKRHISIQRCLEKKPDAFTKKIKDAGLGCACKNNRCLKKYCECFRMNLMCSSNCTCKGCGNGEEKWSTAH